MALLLGAGPGLKFRDAQTTLELHGIARHCLPPLPTDSSNDINGMWQNRGRAWVIRKAFLDQLGLKVDTPVDIGIVDDKIVIARRSPGRIGLEARLAMCNFDQPMTAEERAWLDAPAVGDEAI